MSPLRAGAIATACCLVGASVIIAAWQLADWVYAKVGARTKGNFAASLLGGLVVWSAFVGGFVAASMYLVRWFNP